MQKALIFSQVWLTFSPMTMVGTYHQNESADRRKRSRRCQDLPTEQEIAVKLVKGATAARSEKLAPAARSENRTELRPRTDVVVEGEGSGWRSRMEVGAGDGGGVKRRRQLGAGGGGFRPTI